MKYDTEKLNQLNVLSVAERLGIQLDRSNRSICFAHKETKPSLQFYPNTNTWHCFGCGIGSRVIDLVMQYSKCDFISACSWLSESYGISCAINVKRKLMPHQNKKSINVNIKSEKFYIDEEINKWVLENTVLDDKAIEYMVQRRKISIDTLIKYNVTAIDDIKLFFEKLKQQFNTDRLLKGGYYKVSEYGEIRPVWWKGGIVIPYFNISNQLQTMQMRCYDDSYGKYLFLHGVKTCIFNEHLLSNLKPMRKVVICEGAMDALCLLDKGINAVGIPGVNNMKDEWYHLFENYDNIIIFDNDQPGILKAQEIKSKMNSLGINTRIIKLGKYKDINEMVIQEGGI